MFAKITLENSLNLSGFNTINVTTLHSMFQEFNGITINFNGFNTSNVIDMTNMFKSAKLTGELDLSSFDTSKVEYMKSMFSNFSVNSSLDISHFKTDSFRENGISFDYALDNITVNGDLRLFDCDKPLNSVWISQAYINGNLIYPFKSVNDFFCSNSYINGNLDLSNLDVSSYTTMNYMFEDSTITGILDISSWDTSNVESMFSMFSACDIGEVKPFHFNTSKVKNMDSMFKDSKITAIDLTSFDTLNVTNMNNMFEYCINLKTIYASEKFITDKVDDYTQIFFENRQLTGGNGTKYEYSISNKKYARLDTLEQKGYFTKKGYVIPKSIKFIDIDETTAIMKILCG